MPQVATQWLGAALSGGRYQITRQLGEGGMGTVYEATDRTLGTKVVIKVPHAAMLRDADFAQRFAREIRSLVKLSHPHIVKVIDVGVHQGSPFAVMQHLAGGSLEGRRVTGGPQLTDLSRWLEDVAKALDFVHQQNYLHRDIKPGNILFDEHGNVYLSDFGIAKAVAEASAQQQQNLTGTGMVLGTPDYMAPELIMGQTVDGRVDQYALAVTVYELLSGRRPFTGPTPTAVMVAASTQPPTPIKNYSPYLSDTLCQVIHRGLAKNPQQRYPSCTAFAQAFHSAVSGSPSVPPVSELVQLACPTCSRTLKVPANFAGRQVGCPNCKSSLTVAPDRSTLVLTSSRPGGGTVVLGGIHPIVPGTPITAVFSNPPTETTREIQSFTNTQTVPRGTERKQTLRSQFSRIPVWMIFCGIGLLVPVVLFVVAFRGRTASSSGAASQVLAAGPSGTKPETGIREEDAASTTVVAVGLDSEKPETGNGAAASTTVPSTGPGAEQPKAGAGEETATPTTLSEDSSGASDQATPQESFEISDSKVAFKNSIGMRFVLVPAGEFEMGRSESTEVLIRELNVQNHKPEDFNGEQPAHHVRITKAFYLGQHEVTVGQLRRFCKATGTKLDWEKSGKGGIGMKNGVKAMQSPDVSPWSWGYAEQTDQYPAVNVSWNDAMAFCAWLSQAEGHHYRLPTEAEWEYACRAGTNSRYSSGDDPKELDQFANVEDFALEKRIVGISLNSRNDGFAFTSPVGSFKPNDFGLFDMHGNVAEFCSDFAAAEYYQGSPASDPKGPENGTKRVARGGHWGSFPVDCRSANRGPVEPDMCQSVLGFRIVRDVD